MSQTTRADGHVPDVIQKHFGYSNAIWCISKPDFSQQDVPAWMWLGAWSSHARMELHLPMQTRPEWDRAGSLCQLGLKRQLLANLWQNQAIKSRQESCAIYFWKKCAIYLAWLDDFQYPLWIKHTDKLGACKGKLWVLASGGHYCCSSGNCWNSFRVLGGVHWLPSTLQEFWLLTVLASGVFQS